MVACAWLEVFFTVLMLLKCANTLSVRETSLLETKIDDILSIFKQNRKVQRKQTGPNCAPTITTKTSGSFKSPNYPQRYPTSAICEYTIKFGNQVVTLNIKFNKLDVEKNVICGFDWISLPVPNGEPYRICGTSTAGKSYSIPGVSGDYTIQFVSDFDTVGIGFVLNYNIGTSITGASANLGCPMMTCANYCANGYRSLCGNCACATTNQNCQQTQTTCSCGYTIDQQRCPVCQCARQVPVTFQVTNEGQCSRMSANPVSGSFTSPGSPGDYASNSDCPYTIAFGSDVRDLLITFTMLDVEYDVNCGYDRLLLPVPGGDPYKVCGYNVNGKSYKIPNVSGDYTMRFITDLSTVGKGFHLNYYSTPSNPVVSKSSPCPYFTCTNFCVYGYNRLCNSCTCAGGNSAFKICGHRQSCTCAYTMDNDRCPICDCGNGGQSPQTPGPNMATSVLLNKLEMIFTKLLTSTRLNQEVLQGVNQLMSEIRIY